MTPKDLAAAVSRLATTAPESFVRERSAAAAVSS